jgi:hypothetical protein
MTRRLGGDGQVLRPAAYDSPEHYRLIVEGRGITATAGTLCNRESPPIGKPAPLFTGLPLKCLLSPPHPCSERTDNAPKVRFSTTLGEEPEVKVALV